MINNEGVIRKPHVVLDLETRQLKAKKIEQLLNLEEKSEYTLLEVGTGSGGIASYFANQTEKKINVKAVDVVDNRLVSEGFEFQLVEDVTLPFHDESFDIVISNHVIEHVGLYDQQINHLKELSRVLKKNGKGYLAVPNRWMLFEPHYNLIFLSWFPKKYRSAYLKYKGKGFFYDCEPLEMHEIETMFSKVSLSYKNKCVDALKLTFQLERPNSKVTFLLKVLPEFLYKPFVWLIPTLIYTFHRSDSSR
jgi:ubiquinone/menaquinone biosynthesis C-methylase UbiE